jgi:cell wall-associated NlpC family hydrolase
LPQAVYPDAAVASVAPRRKGAALRRVTLVLLAVVMTVGFVAIESPAPTQASSYTQAQRIVRAAKSHLGRRFQMGATGPRRFDCSGLVYRVYKETGLINKIGGGRMGATAYYNWFRRRGLASRSNPRKGDLVVWGRGAHLGIYVGHGRAVSALINPWGVSKHGVKWITSSRFTAYLHVKLAR